MLYPLDDAERKRRPATVQLINYEYQRVDLDRLARSAARLARRSMVLSLVEGGAVPALYCRRIGPALLFERLWTETGCRAVIAGLAGRRNFGFAVERAVFLTVLHRLMVSGSDRSAIACVVAR